MSSKPAQSTSSQICSTSDLSAHLQDDRCAYSQMSRLPSPQPIDSDLAALGISPDVAHKLSLLYLQKAEALKKATETIMDSEIASIPRVSGCMEFETLLQRLFAARERNYKQTLQQWSAKAIDVAQTNFSCKGLTQADTPISRGHRRSTPFKTEYLPLFEYAFSKDRFPSREDKKHLARISGMSYRQVSVWFQNRRCRSGKVTPAKTRPMTVGQPNKCLRHEGSTKTTQTRSNSVTLDWASEIPSYIDLTNAEDKQRDPWFLSVEGSKLESLDNYGNRLFNEQNDISMSSTTDISPSCTFPTSYAATAASVDPFAVKADPSLWYRSRGRKRPRFSERTIELDEIIQDTRNMNVGERTERRDIKPLPKQHNTSLGYPAIRFPFTLSSRRTASSSTTFSDISISTSSHVSNIESVDATGSSENCTGLWGNDRHDRDGPSPSPIYLSDNSSSDSLSSTHGSLEFIPGSHDSGEESDFAPCQKDTGGLKLWTPSYVRSSIQKPELRGWGKLLAVIPSSS